MVVAISLILCNCIIL